MASIETRRKLRAIRRLSAGFPDRTAEERLEKIAGIVSGALEPTVGRPGPSPDLMERLKAGQASRSPRNAADKRPKTKDEEEAEKKKRGSKGGRDRKERGGIDRSADLNM